MAQQDPKELIKNDLKKILFISSTYDMTDSATVKRVFSILYKKQPFGSEMGDRYLHKLADSIKGRASGECVLCKRNESKDGFICPSCMNKYSHGKYKFKSELEEKPVLAEEPEEEVSKPVFIEEPEEEAPETEFVEEPEMTVSLSAEEPEEAPLQVPDGEPESEASKEKPAMQKAPEYVKEESIFGDFDMGDEPLPFAKKPESGQEALEKQETVSEPEKKTISEPDTTSMMFDNVFDDEKREAEKKASTPKADSTVFMDYDWETEVQKKKEELFPDDPEFNKKKEKLMANTSFMEDTHENYVNDNEFVNDYMSEAKQEEIKTGKKISVFTEDENATPPEEAINPSKKKGDTFILHHLKNPAKEWEKQQSLVTKRTLILFTAMMLLAILVIVGLEMTVFDEGNVVVDAHGVEFRTDEIFKIKVTNMDEAREAINRKFQPGANWEITSEEESTVSRGWARTPVNCSVDYSMKALRGLVGHSFEMEARTQSPAWRFTVHRINRDGYEEGGIVYINEYEHFFAKGAMEMLPIDDEFYRIY